MFSRHSRRWEEDISDRFEKLLYRDCLFHAALFLLQTPTGTHTPNSHTRNPSPVSGPPTHLSSRSLVVVQDRTVPCWTGTGFGLTALQNRRIAEAGATGLGEKFTTTILTTTFSLAGLFWLSKIKIPRQPPDSTARSYSRDGCRRITRPHCCDSGCRRRRSSPC